MAHKYAHDISRTTEENGSQKMPKFKSNPTKYVVVERVVDEQTGDDKFHLVWRVGNKAGTPAGDRVFDSWRSAREIEYTVNMAIAAKIVELL
jgi:hypothetical protein